MRHHVLTQNSPNAQSHVLSARSACSALIVLALVGGVRGQQLPTAIPQTKFASGQNIVPYFEGWIKNVDGSVDMVFGYFNRNWEEQLSIPVGPDNLVEPGGPDRGQPTFFLPRRQGWVYRVRVPSDFGKQVLTWTIKANGKTEKAYGELLPVEEITERIIMTRGNLNRGDDDPNTPPTVTIAPVQNAVVNAAVMLTASVTDDGLPKPRPTVTRPRTTSSDGTIRAQANSSGGGARPRGLNVSWMQIRGPAKAAVEPSSAVPVSDGKATATARFSMPGTYVLRATANDGALSTRADVTITVGGTMSAPLIENDRVTVWDVTAADPSAPHPQGDSVWISLARPGEAIVKMKGSRGDAAALGGRAIVIDLKETRVPPLANRTGYPNAFPRPGVKKLLETDRVIVWDYAWTPNVPTPMHFHDKDVVVTYVENGALKSTTPDGQSTANEFAFGTVRFNPRDRAHTEVLTTAKARAIITELK